MFQNGHALVFLSYEVKKGTSSRTNKPYSLQLVKLADPVTYKSFELPTTMDCSKIDSGTPVLVELNVEQVGFNVRVNVASVVPVNA